MMSDSKWLSNFFCVQASEQKLSVAQEELAANQTHQSGLESQIQDLKSARSLLEQQLAKRDEKLQQKEQTLKELQKQKVWETINT